MKNSNLNDQLSMLKPYSISNKHIKLGPIYHHSLVIEYDQAETHVSFILPDWYTSNHAIKTRTEKPYKNIIKKLM